VPRLFEFYPGICLTTEEKARKNLSRGSRGVLVYILHITKTPTHTHTHAHTPTHYKTHTHTHTFQNYTKPPQYKLKQTQYEIYPIEIDTV
jgi:hypothetical protein